MKQHRTTIFFVSFLLLILATVFFLNIFIGPMLIGFLVSYLLNPLFVYLERRGITRNTSAVISIILIVIIASLAVWVLLPIVIAQIQSILTRLSDFRVYLNQTALPKLQNFVSKFNGARGETWTMDNIFPFRFDTISRNLISSLSESTRYVLSTLLFVILTPLFMFIFMKHLPKFYSMIGGLVPVHSRTVCFDFFKEVDLKVKSVVRGLLFIMSIMSVLYSIAFLLIGLPTAITVGLSIGIARMVPGLDTITGMILCSLVLIVNNCNLQMVLATFIAFGILQSVDMFIINPRVMGKYSGLHPVLILLSAMTFAYWFGLYGVLIAIPTVTIVKVAVTRMTQAYKKTAFFKH